jgi:spore maturation protein A
LFLFANFSLKRSELMLTYFYVGMLVFSILSSLTSGSIGNLTNAAMEGASSAVTLCLSMAGPLCLWAGVGTLMDCCGLRQLLSRPLTPVLGRLFPKLHRDPVGFSALCANVTANLLGLGNAATPMGIEACRAMGDHSGTATAEQCRLITLNTASIQLLPTTVAAVRAGLGCQTPLDILPCVLLTSLCSVTVGLGMCQLLGRVCHDI